MAYAMQRKGVGEMPESPDSQGQLTVEDGMDVVVVLLYAPGRSGQANEPIDGITRLQKLIFLLQEGIGPKDLLKEVRRYGYEPYKLGPYSCELQKDVEELRSAGILRGERLDYWLADDSDKPGDVDPQIDVPSARRKRIESTRFVLARDLGCRVGQELWEALSGQERVELAKFKAFFNSLSLRQLLIFTYERFPRFTTESEIREELGLL